MLEELDAIDELHREVPMAVLRDELVKRSEVGRGHVSYRPKLVLEVTQPLPLLAVDGLQCHTLATPITRLVDDAHRPRADAADDDVAPQRDRAVRRGRVEADLQQVDGGVVASDHIAHDGLSAVRALGSPDSDRRCQLVMQRHERGLLVHA
ncbi:hypothetical protein WMF16_31985 [Sorangium sp. So ce388]